MSRFELVLLCLGGLLIFGSLVSGLVGRSLLSLAATFVVCGLILGESGLGLLPFAAGDPLIEPLATCALIVILFRDGLEIDTGTLRKHWHLPLRKLLLTMPLTAALIAGFAHYVLDFAWQEAFLIGALLSPTDPILSSSVIQNARVPRRIRASLNLESGLNDGLALPAVLALSASLVNAEDFDLLSFILEDISVGIMAGVLVGVLASAMLPRRDSRFPEHAKSLYALGSALAAYGVAAIPHHGNGFIAVFIASAILGLRRPDIGAAFEERSADIVELLKLGVFVVFGAMLTPDMIREAGPLVLLFVAWVLLAARPLAILLSLYRDRSLDLTEKLFVGWFGPRGIATVVFGLLVLGDGVPNGERIFAVCSLVVFCSILLHGSTDSAGANWIARRAKRKRFLSGTPEPDFDPVP